MRLGWEESFGGSLDEVVSCDGWGGKDYEFMMNGNFQKPWKEMRLLSVLLTAHVCCVDKAG